MPSDLHIPGPHDRPAGDQHEKPERPAHHRRILPSLTEIWHYLDQALTDAVPLTGEIIWQRAEIREIRLDRANLIAAMRATLGAHHAGERDPLWYLRDELQARGLDDPGTRGRR